MTLVTVTTPSALFFFYKQKTSLVCHPERSLNLSVKDLKLNNQAERSFVDDQHLLRMTVWFINL